MSKDATQKLMDLLKKKMDEQTIEMKEAMTAQLQQVQTSLNTLEVMLQDIQAAASAPPKTRKKAAPKADTAEDAAGDAEDAPAKPVKAPAPKKQTLYNRHLARFKESEDYRKKFDIEELNALIENDESLKKKKPASKLTAVGRLAWNYVKKNKPELFEEIETEFENANEKLEDEAQPAAETVEENTEE